MKPKLIPAVAYLRKSTKGTRADGTERQENSLAQQRREIEQFAAANGYIIIRWYIDEGVSGWKRDGKRPQFDRMLREAKELGDFRVILCDDIDRFSRAGVMDVFTDLLTLKNGGVVALHCVKQGKYDLVGAGQNDIGRVLKLVIDIHGGNDFSRKLGRRLALTRRNKASEGKRSGGNAPYGYNNGEKNSGTIVLGDPAKVQVVKSIFNRFVCEFHSMLYIANELNSQGVKPPRGKHWSNQTVKNILQNEVYKGTFTYNLKKTGEFFILNKDGEVVEAPERGPLRQAWKPTEDGVIRHHDAHEALVDQKTWQAAQDRIASFAKSARLRTRETPFVLTGVLVCDHCGNRMYGVDVKKKYNGKVFRHTEYRCEGRTRFGASVCGNHTIREEKILPFLMERMKAEIDEAQAELIRPKPERFFSDEPVDNTVSELEQSLRVLGEKIRIGKEGLLLEVKHARLRNELSDTVNEWLTEYDALEEQLLHAKNANKPLDWDNAPITDQLLVELANWRKWCEDSFSHDRLGTREVFRQLGAQVRLRWTCEKKQWGKEIRNYYQLATDCSYRLGEQQASLNLAKVHQAPVEGSSNCNRGVDRSYSRTGKG
ncbi:Recombinase [Anatilimnocola aggregata]|uniref:Recombinase n=1 Tax=Anatilimnocola aggregata TaxID=2528021 RepID=A0A517YK39_9BACT|nr:Recombinase [Anatilimnocola aggregata]